jgi:hypothetical protein
MKADDVQVPELSAKLLWSALAAGLILGAGIAFGRWEMQAGGGHAHLVVRMVEGLFGATGT